MHKQYHVPGMSSKEQGLEKVYYIRGGIRGDRRVLFKMTEQHGLEHQNQNAEYLRSI